MVRSKEFTGEWTAAPARRRPPPTIAAVVVAVAMSIVVLWILGGPIAAGLLGAVVAGSLGLSWASQGRRVLRRLGALPAEDPRLGNLVAGVARDLGRPPPRAFVADAPSNAFFVPDGPTGAIVATRALLEAATRTELEAVVAACLVRLDDASLRWVRWMNVFRRLRLGTTPVTGCELDIQAAALTRYPPALAAAIEKAVPAAAPVAGFAFVAGPPWQPDPARRAAELRDL